MNNSTDLSKIVICSERLKLLPISPRFREDIFREFTSEVARYMTPAQAKDISETDSFITSSVQNLLCGIDLQMVIVLRDSEEFIGCAGLHKVDTPTPELGLWIKKLAFGNKYGLESMRLLKNWADAHLNYEYINYPVDSRNIASRRIPEYFGAKVWNERESVGNAGNQLFLVDYRILPNKRRSI